MYIYVYILYVFRFFMAESYSSLSTDFDVFPFVLVESLNVQIFSTLQCIYCSQLLDLKI